MKEGERRPRHRCESNIKNDLQEMGWEGVDWFNLFLVITVMKWDMLPHDRITINDITLLNVFISI
jgi:hypothetical protein